MNLLIIFFWLNGAPASHPNTYALGNFARKRVAALRRNPAQLEIMSSRTLGAWNLISFRSIESNSNGASYRAK